MPIEKYWFNIGLHVARSSGPQIPIITRLCNILQKQPLPLWPSREQESIELRHRHSWPEYVCKPAQGRRVAWSPTQSCICTASKRFSLMLPSCDFPPLQAARYGAFLDFFEWLSRSHRRPSHRLLGPRLFYLSHFSPAHPLHCLCPTLATGHGAISNERWFHHSGRWRWGRDGRRWLNHSR